MAISLFPKVREKLKIIENCVNTAIHFLIYCKTGVRTNTNLRLLGHPYLGIIMHAEIGCNLVGNCRGFQQLIRSSGNKMKQDPQDNLVGGNYDPLLCDSHTMIKLAGGTQHPHLL